ncbi:MAG: hypothetical protein ACLQUW_12410 [Desulfobaccales bacterium]
MYDLILKIFAGIAIATFSSWVTVKLSLRRFRAEKLWERQVDAYLRVIEALHNSKTFSEHSYNAELQMNKLSDERSEEIVTRSIIAQDEIDKAIDLGAFLFSVGALNILKEYQKEISEIPNDHPWLQYLEDDLLATKKCLKNFIEIAKNDLKFK